MYRAVARMFWREDRAWPLTHYATPMALYFASRNLFLSLWLIWLWESVERVLELAAPLFHEPWYDSFIGDPMQGSLGILTLWLADRAFGWDTAVLASVPVGARLGQLALVFSTSMLVERKGLTTRTVRWGVLVYALAYLGGACALYLPYVLHDHSALASVVSWQVVVAVQCLQILPRLPGLANRPYRHNFSVFSRVLVVGLTALVVLLVVVGVQRAG